MLRSMSLKKYSDTKNKFNEDAGLNKKNALPPNFQKGNTPDSSISLTEELFIAKKRLLHQVRLEKPSFTDDIVYSDLLSIIFIKLYMKNNRIERQKGAFILTGLYEGMNPYLVVEEIEKYRLKKINNSSNKTTVFLIESKMKERLIDWLNTEGISESYLFPEMPYVMKTLKEEIENRQEEQCP